MRDRIAACTAPDIAFAAGLADQYPELGGRDLLHAAVMRRLGSERLISADTGFDRIPGIRRLDPGRFDEWRATVEDARSR